MLKLIPQEQPDSTPRGSSRNSSGSGRKGKKNSSHTARSSLSPNLPKRSITIVELTGKKLIHLSMAPENHTDKELSQIMYDMHRSMLHIQRDIQRRRQKKMNKKRKGK